MPHMQQSIEKTKELRGWRKFFLFLGVMLILFVSAFVFAYGLGYVLAFAAPHQEIILIVILVLTPIYLLPCLMIPYAVFYWLSHPRVGKSVLGASISGLIFSMLLILINMPLNGELFPLENWDVYIFTLCPGTLLAYFGTRLGQGKNRLKAKAGDA